jgi:DNA relaxase NicK
MKPTATTIDWLRFRTQGDPGQVVEGLRPLFGPLGATLQLGKHGRGLFGYRHSLPLLLGPSVPVGRIDFGGESQRGWSRVDVPGKGCSWVQDWDAIDAVEALPSCELRRTDIALTTWKGEVTHDRVVQAHAAGKFTTRGRPPNLRQITNSDPTAGRTCYVGARESDKFFRAYEKGFELASKLRLPGTLLKIDGHNVEDIYRCELELKSEGTTLTFEVIEQRDQFFAGAYPFCKELLPHVEPDILQRRPEKGPQRELMAALANCRAQFGNTLFTALTAFHGDIGAVWDKVVGKDHNRHLVEAGVLLVDHD